MKIQLTKENKELTGYDIICENNEDRETLATVRDMIFFGIEDSGIQYAGREHTSVEDTNYKTLDKLKFRKRKYNN